MEPRLTGRERGLLRPGVLLASLGIGCMVLSTIAHSMTFERIGEDLFATGAIVGPDVVALRSALDSPGIRRLILVNSPGGEADSAMLMVRTIQRAGLETLVSGYCASACSLLFTSGKARAFATGHPASRTWVGIHGGHSIGLRRMDPSVGPILYAHYKSMLGDRFDSALFQRAIYGHSDPEAIFIVREIERRPQAQRRAQFCPSAFAPASACESVPDADALSLGIVTSPRTEIIELPPSMRPAPAARRSVRQSPSGWVSQSDRD